LERPFLLNVGVLEGGKTLGFAISNTPSGTVHRWKVLWAAFITYLLDSYDLIVLAIAMPVLLKVLDISLPEGGLIGSATMIGAVAGGVVFGLIAENHGRRFSLILALLWLGICMGFVYFIHTWGMWLVLRFITGIAVGGIWGPCSALIAEHWALEYRGRAASLVLSSFAIGAVLASFVGRLVLTVDWRFLFLVGTSSILFAAAVAWLIPPDPARPGRDNGSRGEKIGIGVIFEKGLARTTLLATLVSFINLAGYWGAAYWIPTFLTLERGLSLTAMANFSLMMYVGMFFGFQFFGVLSDRIGRRNAMIVAFIMVALSIAVYIVIPNPTFLFWWGIVVGFGLPGVGGILGAYYAELFPERIRAYAGGFCWNTGRIGAILAPYTIGYLGKHYGLQTGLAVTCVVYILGAALLLLLPETLKRKA